MEALLSIYWKLNQRTDTLDYKATHAGSWKSNSCSEDSYICGEIYLYFNPLNNIAQALIVYDERSQYRAGWKIKVDLECNSTKDRAFTLSTTDQTLSFRVLKTEEGGSMLGSYTSSSPTDSGTWSVDLLSCEK